MNRWLLRIAAAAVVFALAPFAAQAANVSVTGAWFRVLPASLPAGGYFTMKNTGGHDVALVGARSPACSSLMLHRSMDRSGMSTMKMVDKVNVPAHVSVSFAPGGYHLMCMKPAMKPGGKVRVTLKFGDGTARTVLFAVRDAMGK